MSNLIWLDEKNLIERLQVFVDDINDLFFNNDQDNLDSFSFGNFIFIVLLMIVIGLIGFKSFRDLVFRFINIGSKTLSGYFSLDTISNYWFLLFLQDLSQKIFRSIQKYPKSLAIISGGYIINLATVIIEEIFEYFEIIKDPTKSGNLYSNFRNSINELIEFSTKFYEEDKLLITAYKFTSISLTFLNRASWSSIRLANNVLNYPIFGLKFTGFDIPIPKQITQLNDYKISINIGFTPIIFVIIIIIAYLYEEERIKILNDFEVSIYSFFTLISNNKHLINLIKKKEELIYKIK